MTPSSKSLRGPGAARSVPAVAVVPERIARRGASVFWRAAEHVARVCTSGELATLADHHQLGQPALAARFRAAAVAMDARSA